MKSLDTLIASLISIPPQHLPGFELETLLGDKAQLLNALKEIGGLIPGGSEVVGLIVDRL